MKKYLFPLAALVAVAPAVASAQDTTSPDAASAAPVQDTAAPAPDAATATPASDQPTAPDGSRAFGIEPYFGILGGYHSFDRRSDFGIAPGTGRMNGALVGGVIGVNIPLGPAFVGVEGDGTKGFNDIDWEYGVKGRIGARAGESGLIYASAGYQWINGKHGFGNDKNWIYGVGVEVGPKDIGLNGAIRNSGVRFRLQMETYNFQSLQPMGGVIFHF